jgi:hypothetical protein
LNTSIPFDKYIHIYIYSSFSFCTGIELYTVDEIYTCPITGGQILVKNAKHKKSRENGSGSKVFLRKDLPRRSRTKSNYVKISKFGVKIDGEVFHNGNKVLGKCTEKEKETICNLDSGTTLGTDEAPVGLELIADDVDKEGKSSFSIPFEYEPCIYVLFFPLK